MKSSANISSELIQITKTSDLLKAKHINDQIAKFGRNEVSIEVSKSINKCLRAFDISIDNSTLQMFIEDILDVYKFDSIEDIQICLKNGRQGKYGKTYNKLNMIVFNEWMSQHLEQKAIARESKNDKNKHDFKDKTEYTKTVLQGIENLKEIAKSKKKTTDKEAEYQKFKAEYEAKSKTI